MSHVDEGTLHAYLDGELPAPERAALEAHLAACAGCRATLAEERALLERASALLGSARPVERPAPPFEQLRRSPKRSPWSVRTPVAWAASITLALGLGYYLRTPSEQLAPAPQPQPQPVAMAEDRAANAAPVERAPARQRQQPMARRPAPAEADQLGAEKLESPTVVALEPRVQLRNAPPKAVAPPPSLGAASAVEEASLARGARNVVVPRDLVATSWPVISRGAAASLLGTDPVGLPGLATRRIRRSPAPDGTVVVEQALDSSTVIRIFQRPAETLGYMLADSAAKDTRRQDESRREVDRLARFVGRLRVEISGPLSPDSLNKLLEQVERLP